MWLNLNNLWLGSGVLTIIRILGASIIFVVMVTITLCFGFFELCVKLLMPKMVFGRFFCFVLDESYISFYFCYLYSNGGIKIIFTNLELYKTEF